VKRLASLVIVFFQVFINLGANQRLNGDGRPFATIDEASMAIVDRLYSGYKDGDGQVGAVARGQEEVRRRFPNMSWIESCHLQGTPPKTAALPGIAEKIQAQSK
jgi:hypothetical protein